MKKYAFVLAGIFALSLTGCNIFIKPGKPAQTQPAEEAVSETEASSEIPSETETLPERRKYPLQECTVDHVTFSACGYWEHRPEEGHEGTYVDTLLNEGYQLQGISPLGSYTPDTFFQTLVNSYRETCAIEKVDETVSPFTTADGLDAYVGRVEMISSNTYFSVDVLIVPQKNIVATFSGQCQYGETLSTDIREMTETAVFDIAAEDMVTGKVFTVEDGSEIQLGTDGRFLWFREAGDPDSDSVSGEYEVLRGQKAIDRVVYMTEYGLTYEELEGVIRADMNGYKPGGSDPLDFLNEDSGETGYQICTDSFYAVILHNQKLASGKDVKDVDTQTLYIGYYLPELNCLDLTNCNTASHTMWTVKE